MPEVGAWPALAERLTALAGEDRFSGSVLVRRGSTTLLEVGAGLAHRGTGTPVRPATRFGLASLSKPFTAAAVLSCWRDGLLDVHDPVVAVLPGPRRPRTLSDRVTVQHLLTHPSGIGDYAEEDEELPGHVADYGSLWWDRPPARMLSPDDFLPMYADAAPVADPGREFHYSNAGYVLLGAVLEEATGQPFAEAVAERVFRPAGMTGSGYLRTDEAHPDVAVGYLPRESVDHPWRSNVHAVPVVGGGDGGAFAPAGDLDRFLRSVASGRLLGTAVTGQMLARHVVVDDEAWMGLGVFVGEGWFGHGGGDPGVETGARYFPATGTTVVVLCNQEGCLDPAWDLVEAALLSDG